jgi:hypothetical protein
MCISKESREKFLIEEVKVIQEIIKRMAGNSFLIKAWTLTLIVGAFVFKAKNINISIAYLPLFCFWYLDAYYLRQERLFRKVYDWVREYRLKNNDNIFNVNPARFNNEVDSILKIMRSISILPFYGIITIALAIATLYEIC